MLLQPLDELFSQKLQKAIEITDKPRENQGDEVDGHTGAETTNDAGYAPLSVRRRYFSYYLYKSENIF